MTVPRVNALVEYWNTQCPPPHRSLAAQIGFKPQKRPSKVSQEEQEAAAEALMQMFGYNPADFVKKT